MLGDPAAFRPLDLHLVDRVVTEMLALGSGLDAKRILLVGAAYRDAVHASLSTPVALRATSDVDLSLIVSELEEFESFTRGFVRLGHTGVRFDIAGIPTDIVPFGDVEHPPGVVAPPRRPEGLNVWGYREVFAASMPCQLPCGAVIRVPRVSGYAALKLSAFIDRAPRGDDKDAQDLAAVLLWHEIDGDTSDRLWDGDLHELTEHEWDVGLATAHLVGEDAARTVGATRQAELLDRLNDQSVLTMARALQIPAQQGVLPDSVDRRMAVAAALWRGFSARLSPP